MLPPEVCGCWLCCTLVWASSLVLTEFHISNIFSMLPPRLSLQLLSCHKSLQHGFLPNYTAIFQNYTAIAASCTVISASYTVISASYTVISASDTVIFTSYTVLHVASVYLHRFVVSLSLLHNFRCYTIFTTQSSPSLGVDSSFWQLAISKIVNWSSVVSYKKLLKAITDPRFYNL